LFLMFLSTSDSRFFTLLRLLKEQMSIHAPGFQSGSTRADAFFYFIQAREHISTFNSLFH
ncbi:hypothetical protein LJC72_10430, partial [Bacteroides sp. OttesenSCG-928-D19]|nr:hypothetical protein [Bacteroides sp. OttesenSCG-928-D19]